MEHDNVTSQEDAFLQPTFTLANRIKRFIWQITWFLLCSWTPIPFHGWRVFIMKLFGAKMGKNNAIYPTCTIWAPWLLTSEDVVTIGPGVEVYNPGGIYLAHHAIISQGAYVCGATHDYNSPQFTYIKKLIKMEPYSWICAKAIVLPGVTCFEGSVLGAGSVTSKNLESWSVYTGNPARLIKRRQRQAV